MKILVFTLLASLTTTCLSAIDGYWSSPKYNITIKVEETSKGIRVKRIDKGGWLYYKKVGRGEYVDYHGNSYVLTTTGKMTWYEDNSSKHIDFYQKANDHLSEFDRRGNDYFSTRQLEGNWINQSTGQKIRVKTKASVIRVKADRRGWVTFHSQGGGLFIDDRGNRYDYNNRILIYTSENRDFIMKFVRY